ncbi:Uncharacterised protein [Pseudomonas aeruginosa]|nr:Uncharacterised protein [Pseudomonas aeruginosa]
MARLLAILAFISSPIAAATIYTEERDPIYERASIALFCMNHFYNRRLQKLSATRLLD